MQPESVIVYERVLSGEHWPYKYVGTATSKERTVEILRYLFFEKLGIRDFDEAKAILDRTFIKDYKLFAVIRSIPKPPELLPNEYDHVLWLIFPERQKGEHALVLKVYSEVLSGKRRCFPHGYFTDAVRGRYCAEVCVKHMCKRLLHYSGDRIAREFCDSSGIKTLAKYRLKILLNHVYFSLSDMMFEIYPQLVPKMMEYQREKDGRRHRYDEQRRIDNGNSECLCNPSGNKGGKGRKKK